MYAFLLFQHLVSQQKDPDTEEYRKLLSEKEVHTKRIQQLTEEIGRLKAEIARYIERSLKSYIIYKILKKFILLIYMTP